ncbi:MAG: ATP-dependent DNA helicase RecQ [Bacteroidota bacterium]
MDIRQILLKYWGYSRFRPLQEDIINAVLENRDTLALLPTGGGKSICYQVPALAREGVCIVVSPLIALMKDQVLNLKNRGINAAAIYSGMSRSEMDIMLDNAVYGDVKLLYLSPERLETELLRERLKKMKVNLLAIDEAHCISQWGYDFRPPYLRIAVIRELLPGVPVLALTATATPDVVNDIQEKLGFKTKNALSKSFERDNLAYMVAKEEDKLKRLLTVTNNIQGTGIVYVRNRKKTREIAEFLQKNGVSADYYHAGLDPKTRDARQNAWMKNEKRIIVSTNAFGMGIDKPDVRFVVHIDLPDCLEAYFQEAGRGGRDEKKAYAALFWEEADIIDAKKNLEQSYPDSETLRHVYQALGNYFQLATGSGRDATFEFSISDFCNSYRFSPVIAYSALKSLQRDGYIFLSDGFNETSRLLFTASKEDLYRFQVEHPKYDGFIKMLLRMYTGMFNDFVKIDEDTIARRAEQSRENMVKMLRLLVKFGLCQYIEGSDKPKITFLTERFDVKSLNFSDKATRDLKVNAAKRLDAIIDYIRCETKCRSQLLLAYFGEKESKRCGVCDVCLERNKLSLSELEFSSMIELLKPMLKAQSLTLDQIVDSLKGKQAQKIISVIRWLIDNDKVIVDDAGLHRWR